MSTTEEEELSVFFAVKSNLTRHHKVTKREEDAVLNLVRQIPAGIWYEYLIHFQANDICHQLVRLCLDYGISEKLLLDRCNKKWWGLQVMENKREYVFPMANRMIQTLFGNERQLRKDNRERQLSKYHDNFILTLYNLYYQTLI